MKLRDIIGLGVALVLAVGVAFLTRFFLAGEKKAEPEKPAQQQLQLAKILIANKSLSEGDIIGQGSLKWQNWPKDALSPTYVQEGAVTIESLSGAVVRHPLDQGEPIVMDDLIKPGDKGILAAIVSPGKRAISIEVKPSTVSSGLIIPGDNVDVIFSKATAGEGGRASESRTIVKNVKVLAMGSEMASTKKAPETPPKVATLEVTPAEAEIIEASSREGTLSLSLVGLGKEDAAPVTEEPPVEDETITVIRGKEKSEVQVQVQE